MKSNIVFCLLMLANGAVAQTFTEKISKELSFEKRSDDNALIVANLNGNIRVEGYPGDKILLEVEKTIRAKTEARLQVGKSEIQIGIIDRADTLIVYVQEGCHQFRKKEGEKMNSGWHHQGWGYQSLSPSRHDCHAEYDYKMEFTIKVPQSLHLMVSTVNDGDIIVENVDGVVKAGNINGSIRLSNLKREAVAHTINGDVDIEYATNPGRECRFYTLNGDINALFQPGLSANMKFESFNGSFYTNITRIENLPLKVEKANRGDGVQFKINGNQYQVGQGGVVLDFETFNGNVYLKEKSN